MKAILKSALLATVVLSGTSAMAAKTLSCYSGKNAPAYHSVKGQWTLKADIQSEFTLKEAKLKNRQQKGLGEETSRVTYDKKTGDARLFTLKQDVYCKYELLMPRDWSKSSSFQASLDMSCDEMFDGTATLYCSVR